VTQFQQVDAGGPVPTLLPRLQQETTRSGARFLGRGQANRPHTTPAQQQSHGEGVPGVPARAFWPSGVIACSLRRHQGPHSALKGQSFSVLAHGSRLSNACEIEIQLGRGDQRPPPLCPTGLDGAEAVQTNGAQARSTCRTLQLPQASAGILIDSARRACAIGWVRPNGRNHNFKTPAGNRAVSDSASAITGKEGTSDPACRPCPLADVRGEVAAVMPSRAVIAPGFRHWNARHWG